LAHKEWEKRFAATRAREDAVWAGEARAAASTLLEWAEVVSCRDDEDSLWARRVSGRPAHVVPDPDVAAEFRAAMAKVLIECTVVPTG
jgi:hypothetical protein